MLTQAAMAMPEQFCSVKTLTESNSEMRRARARRALDVGCGGLADAVSVSRQRRPVLGPTRPGSGGTRWGPAIRRPRNWDYPWVSTALVVPESRSPSPLVVN